MSGNTGLIGITAIVGIWLVFLGLAKLADRFFGSDD